jgi:hypothetical protein
MRFSLIDLIQRNPWRKSMQLLDYMIGIFARVKLEIWPYRTDIHSRPTVHLRFRP